MIENINEFIPNLTEKRKIVITAHTKPDADAVGSSLGLKLALDKLGHEVTVIMPNDYPSFIKWMPRNNQVKIHEDNEEEKFPENEGRTRADVLLENDSETIIDQPPGITPKELNNLTVKAKKVKSMKVSKKGTVDNIVKRVSRSRKTTPKSRDIFKTIKKNWLSI